LSLGLTTELFSALSPVGPESADHNSGNESCQHANDGNGKKRLVSGLFFFRTVAGGSTVFVGVGIEVGLDAGSDTILV
jgi:hypothetical protein